jgi:hypothetical protein
MLDYVLTLPDETLITLAIADWEGLEMICNLLSVELSIEKDSRNIN